MIYTVIAKPTKSCNADCGYCSSPPDSESGWTVDVFKVIWDRIKSQLSDNAVWIWHGGEPMLQGPDFYVECFKIAKIDKPNILFSLQSNLLLYKSSRWKKVFNEVFDGRISSSFDPDEMHRTIKGSTERYTKQFYKKIDEVMSDGFKPLVIGTYSEETAHLGVYMYEKSKSLGDKGFSLRFNYRYPAGRASGEGALISPETYGKMLLDVYNRWMVELPNFLITPLDQMLKQAVTSRDLGGQCPWTHNCGGKFIGILPNGDVYNCGEFSDLDDTQYRYGNLIEGWVSGPISQDTVQFIERPSIEEVGKKLMATEAARLMRRRVKDLPGDCRTCRHFHACQGGCMRDAELFDRGLGGKFFYCASWKMVFDRIKESIQSKEADKLLIKMGFSPEESRLHISTRMKDLV
jgi:radical SAM protein with 4Fe4S-binding SPASM domain